MTVSAIVDPIFNTPTKRKRAPSDAPPKHPFAPRLDITPRESTENLRDGPSSGADSPRSAVATQLEGLEIESRGAVLEFGSTTADTVHKKAKRDDIEDEASMDSFTDGVCETDKQLNVTKGRGRQLNSPPPLRRVREIAETPQPQAEPRRARFQPPEVCVAKRDSHSPKRMKSPPLSVADPTTPSPASSTDSASTKSSRSDSSTVASSTISEHAVVSPFSPLELPSLTWQDSEITGHLAQDPEDDGYGINGIGFKPTPALAWARSQRRRQQVTEWRAREAREERRRRLEKRKGSGSDDPNSRDAGKRSVRFA